VSRQPIAPLVYTVEEVADALRLSKPAVYSLIEAGKLQRFHIGVGGGAARILPSELHRYIEECANAERPA